MNSIITKKNAEVFVQIGKIQGIKENIIKKEFMITTKKTLLCNSFDAIRAHRQRRITSDFRHGMDFEMKIGLFWLTE